MLILRAKNSLQVTTGNKTSFFPAIRPLYFAPDVARSGADWLARLQQSDGALPAWVGCLAEQRWPTDIVAQAIRIWAIIDREAYAPCIDRALLRLASLQCPASGGVAYSPDHPHENTWVGVFGLQAASWARGVPHEEMVQWLL